MRFKKIVSGVLAFAMVMTSAFASNAVTVKADDTTGTPDGGVSNTSPDPTTAADPVPMFQFGFDVAANDNVFTDEQSGVIATVKGNGASISAEDKKIGAGALVLDGKTYLEVTKDGKGNLLTGKNAVTVSFYTNSNSTGNDGWVFFAAPDNKKPTEGGRSESYLGISDKQTNVVAERFHNGRGNNTSWTADKTDEWHRIDVVYDVDKTSIYIDGTLGKSGSASKAVADAVGGDDGIIYIGHATWGEHYVGSLDEFKVYDKALTETEIQKLAIKEGALEFIATEKIGMHVGGIRRVKTNAPSFGSAITYTSDDATVASVDAKTGVVNGLKAGNTTITTTLSLGGQEYTATTAVTVKASVYDGEKPKFPVVADYDMTKQGDKLKDTSPYENHANIHGDNVTFANKEIKEGKGEVPVMTLGGDAKAANYVDLPVGIADALTDMEQFTIETKFAKAAGCGENAWLISIGAKVQKTGTNYMFFSPNYVGAPHNNKNGIMRAGVKDSSAEKLFATDEEITAGKYYIVDTVFDHGKVRLYVDGRLVQAEVVNEQGETELLDEIDSGYSMQSDILRPGAVTDTDGNEIIGYIAKSCWEPDGYFKGDIASFKIYDKAMTTAEIAENNEELGEILQEEFNALGESDFFTKAVLGKNKDLAHVTHDLALPSKVGNFDVTWEGDEDGIISSKGTVTNDKTESKTVKLKVKTGKDGLQAEREFTVTVLKLSVTPIEAAIAGVSNLQAKDYSERTWTPFAEALNNATSAIAEGAAKIGQSALDALQKALEDAKEALRRLFKMTVDYNYTGAPSATRIDVEEGSIIDKNITVLDPGERDGYVFEYWQKDGEEGAYNFNEKVTESFTLKAIWSKLFTVTIDNGVGEPVVSTVKEGEKIEKPADPEREGYVFLGWYDGETEFDFTKGITKDVTITAKWAQGHYVTLVSDGETWKRVGVQSGTKFADPGAPEKAGYAFDGWYNGNTKVTFPMDVTADVTLTAKWAKIHTVTFVNDATKNTASVKDGDKVAKPADPTKAGYKFDGWFANGASTAFDFNTPITADITLTAKWTQQTGGTNPPTPPAAVKVSSIKFAAKTYQIAAGKKIDLNKVMTVKPANAANKKVNFTIAKKDSKYASVKNGVVTTKKGGKGKTVTVTATAADGSKKKATVKVKIMKNAVTKVTVKKKTLTVKAGKKVTIKATVKTNGKSANKKLEYTSSNTKYATVNSKGVVSTKKAGKGKTVTITVKSTDGTNKSAKVKVKIKK